MPKDDDDNPVFCIMCLRGNSERYVVICDLDSAQQGLRTIFRWAKDEELSLTRRDALRMGRSLIKQLQEDQ